MMERSVPVRSSLCSGTTTVIVESSILFCITMWLPRWGTWAKPCCSRIAQTSLPESVRSLGNFYSDLGDKHL